MLKQTFHDGDACIFVAQNINVFLIIINVNGCTFDSLPYDSDYTYSCVPYVELSEKQKFMVAWDPAGNIYYRINQFYAQDAHILHKVGGNE